MLRLRGFMAAVALVLLAGPVAAATVYWNVFNIEGESAQNAQFVTYASLSDMLLDANRTGVFDPSATSVFGARNIVGSGSNGSVYWNVFNIEGESAQNAQFVTYASLSDMLLDANRTGVFAPTATSAFGARNIVGSGSNGSVYWNVFNIESESAQNAQFVTYASLSDMLLDANRTGVFDPSATSVFGARNIVGSGSNGSVYWNVFNIEGESAQNAQFVTYASLSDMLLDANRTGVFAPTATSAFGARNIVGSGATIVVIPLEAAETPNQLATAEALQAVGLGNPIFFAIVVLDDDQARNAFDLASGEVHATLVGALVDSSRFLREAVNDRLRLRFDTANPSGTAIWGNAFGATAAFAGDGNAAAYNWGLGGLIGGVDLTTGNWRLGVAGGLQSASIDVPDRASTGDVDTHHVAAYGGFDTDEFAVRVGGAFAWHRVATERTIVFPGFSDTVNASYSARTGQAFGEIALRTGVGGVAIEPFAGLAHVRVETDGFTETGGPAALTVAPGGMSVTLASLGLRFSTVLGDAETRVDAMVAWQHAFGELTPMTSPAFASGEAFAIAGVPVARDALRLGVDIERVFGAGLVATLSYSGVIAPGVHQHAIKGSIAARF